MIRGFPAAGRSLIAISCALLLLCAACRYWSFQEGERLIQAYFGGSGSSLKIITAYHGVSSCDGSFRIDRKDLNAGIERLHLQERPASSSGIDIHRESVRAKLRAHCPYGFDIENPSVSIYSPKRTINNVPIADIAYDEKTQTAVIYMLLPFN